ncbi:HTH-type transcriptional repressor YtrA [Pontiella desulfatans]|uniref:HTH-type transcriptional repressor YtrA n=1 Tax=Pontiella desulfatans TaxID=2750659 RepID=A0A6C2UA38_PONDE|nr:GntR family transcriptional regulator [Pontiella desulfatans]VGO16749.1 HTH-type transcriptional repressor YtrA [Pontiella desulfatans]
MDRKSPAFQIGPITPAASGALYQQVVDGIRREIAAGRLPPETRLPSFRGLAESLMVSLITVKRAYEELEKEGIIYRKQGIGTFVADHGGAKSRESKKKEALALLGKAARDAVQAGMGEKEFIELSRTAIRSEKGSGE